MGDIGTRSRDLACALVTAARAHLETPGRRARPAAERTLDGSLPGVAGVVLILAVLVLVGHPQRDGVVLQPGGSDSVRLVAAAGALFDRTVLKPGEVAVACTPVAVRAEPGEYTFALQAVDVSGPLASNLQLEVDRVPVDGACEAGAGVPVFAGTLTELQSAATQAWSAGDGDQLLRFRARMGGGAGQGQTAAASFRFTLSQLPPAPKDAPIADTPAPDRPAVVAPPAPSRPTTTPPVGTAVVPKAVPTTPTEDAPKAAPVDVPRFAEREGAGDEKESTAPRDRGGLRGILGKLGEAAPIAIWPGLGLLGVPLFLLAQRQLDRGDPKLALAPLYDAELLVPLSAGEWVQVERWCRTASMSEAVR